MSKKKVFLLTAVLVIAAMILGACGGTASATPQAAQTQAPAQVTPVPQASATPEAPKAAAIEYPAAIPVDQGVQAAFDKLAYKAGAKPKIVYMPPATEFAYYMAIGEGIKTVAAQVGADYSLLAPQSGNDINGQMGMLQDVISQKADAIILSTHDESAAAPLVKKAVDQGIEVIIVNSDILKFPTPIQGVVGYDQRKGTQKLGEYVAKMVGDKPTTFGVLEGAPGWHSTQRVGGFLDVIGTKANFTKAASLNGNWNVEGGNTATMDMMQAHKDIQLIFAANDYEIMGAQKAIQTLGKKDILLFGNDGDTACMEEIAAGNINATVNTTPFVMGQIAMQVTLDGLNGKFKGGFVETPTVIVDKSNALEFLKHPETLYPKPSKTY